MFSFLLNLTLHVAIQELVFENNRFQIVHYFSSHSQHIPPVSAPTGSTATRTLHIYNHPVSASTGSTATRTYHIDLENDTENVTL